MTIILKKRLFFIAIIILLCALVYTISHKDDAPNVVFTSIKGERIAMSDLKGKVVLVNFWATDCLPCVTEMPALVKTYQKFNAKGLEIIAVAMPYDPPAQVLNYARIKKPPFPIVDDGLSEISKQFGNIEVTPTTFIFDKQGKLLQRTIGGLDFVQLNQLLDRKLTANQ